VVNFGRRLPPEPGQYSTPVHTFARAAAIPLARSALTFAWYMTRARPEATPLLLGMSQGCAEVIAELSPGALDIIAQQQHASLRPRWEDRPAIWKSLLTAARSTDTEALCDFKLHGVQRMVGELLQLASST
jgi:hypothetical protein